MRGTEMLCPICWGFLQKKIHKNSSFPPKLRAHPPLSRPTSSKQKNLRVAPPTYVSLMPGKTNSPSFLLSKPAAPRLWELQVVFPASPKAHGAITNHIFAY